jgi:hypothetical protein
MKILLLTIGLLLPVSGMAAGRVLQFNCKYMYKYSELYDSMYRVSPFVLSFNTQQVSIAKVRNSSVQKPVKAAFAVTAKGNLSVKDMKLGIVEAGSDVTVQKRLLQGQSGFVTIVSGDNKEVALCTTVE